MKAERRHELHTNALAKFLSDLPLYIRFYADKVLIGVIIVCGVVLLIQYRMNAARKLQESNRNWLASARGGIDQLRQVDLLLNDDVARAQERKKLAVQISTAIDQVLANTKDPADSALRAEALVARGDLNWTLANLPVLPGATTQPVLTLPQSSAEYLDNAEAAYQQALQDYDSHKLAKASALLGLAAIAENRGDWSKAVEWYNAVVSDPAIASTFKQHAQIRLAIIPQLRIPVYLGSYPATRPAMQPTTDQSTNDQIPMTTKAPMTKSQ